MKNNNNMAVVSVDKSSLIKYATAIHPIDFLSPMSFATKLSLRSYLILNETKKERSMIDDGFGIVKNEDGNSYGIRVGYFVKQHTQQQYFEQRNIFGKIKNRTIAVAHDSRKSNVISPILLSDTTLREHMQIIGTTGSGKTALILSIMEQQIKRGGGGIVVFGKGDNDMVQSIYGAMLESNRQNDFYLFDFINANSELLKSEDYTLVNNSINMFDVGDMLSIINMFKDFSGLTSKGDAWDQGASSYLDAVIRVLYKMNEAELIFDIDKINDILSSENTLSEIKKHKQRINGYMLSKYLTDFRLALKLLAVVEKLYRELGNRFNEIVNKARTNERDIVFQKKLVLSDRDRIDNTLRSMIQSQISNQIRLSQVVDLIIDHQDGGIDKISQKLEGSSQGAFYKLGVSASRLSAVADFLEKYEIILKNNDSDIDIVEAVRQGKVIVFNIPGQEPQEAKKISKLIIGILKFLIKKQSRAHKDDDTYLIVLDELNSWAKGSKDEVVGIGDILSVIRGLGFGAIVAHQSDLNSMDGTGIEKSQVEANVGTTIVLKNSDEKISESINKKLKKKHVYYERETRQRAENEKMRDSDYDMREEDALHHSVLTSLNTGQGYFIRNGQFEKMVTVPATSIKYSDNSIEYVPINKFISEDGIIDFIKRNNLKNADGF